MIKIKCVRGFVADILWRVVGTTLVNGNLSYFELFEELMFVRPVVVVFFFNSLGNCYLLSVKTKDHCYIVLSGILC